MRHRFKKLAGALAAAALAAGLAMAGPGTARADVVPASTWNEIFAPEINSSGNTMCVDDPNGSMTEDQPLQLWHCHGYASNGQPQQWSIINVGHNDAPVYNIILSISGACLGLDPRKLNYADWQGSNIVLGRCWINPADHDYPEAQWNLRPATQSPDPANQFEITSVTAPVGSQPYCVEANTFLDQNGNRLIAEPCDPYNSAQWFALG